MRNRWANSIGILLNLMANVLVVCWVVGLVPFAQFERVTDAEAATAAQTTVNDRVSDQLNTLVLLQIKSSINTAQKDSCSAQRTKNQGDLDSANNQLSNLLDRYQKMTGHEFHLQSCDTILVNSN